MSNTVAEPQVALARALEYPVAQAPAELRGLVRIARALVAVPDPKIDPGFVARLEARLLSEVIEEAPVRRLSVISSPPAASPAPVASSIQDSHPTATVTALPRRRFVVRKAMLAAIAAVLAVALPVVASGSALPGTPLYGIKLRMENLRVSLFGGPITDGFAHLDFAERRLHEVDQLVALDRTDLIPQTLDRMQQSLELGTGLILRNTTDARILNRLAGVLRKTNGKLSDLFQEAPSTVRSDILAALVSGRALSAEVAEALGLSIQASRAAASAAPGTTLGIPAGAAASLPNPGSVDVDATAGAPAATGATTPAGNHGESVDSNATSTPCLATMYVGPGSGDVQSTCAAASNERGSGTQPIPADLIPSGPPTPVAPSSTQFTQSSSARTTSSQTPKNHPPIQKSVDGSATGTGKGKGAATQAGAAKGNGSGRGSERSPEGRSS